MNIAVINGTEKKGATYRLKELFLDNIGRDNKITEWYLPKDCPEFCKGCVACVLKGADKCPHYNYVNPIWQSITEADLLVFTSPVYVFHTTGAMKNLLDHFCCRWMAHRPEKAMTKKQAVVITQGIGPFQKSTAKDIIDSLNYWGTGRVYHAGFALTESINWKEISDKRKNKFNNALKKVACKVIKRTNPKPRIKIRLFYIMFGLVQKSIHKMLLKKGEADSLDYMHWKENIWKK